MTASQVEIAVRYGIALPYHEDVTIPPPELFPKKPAWVICEHDGRRVIDAMSWGFPHQVRGASGKMLNKPVTNVRNYVSPFWRSALANPMRRCLVPFTAFSEYGQVRGDDGKLPLHWFDVTSQEITSFAGVWRPVEGGAAFAFLTCQPNPLVAPIHPKAMPVLLHAEDEARWLTCGFEEAIALATPFPSQLMRKQDDRAAVGGFPAGDEPAVPTRGRTVA